MECVDCSDRASVLPPSDSTATALALPARVPRPRPLQKKASVAIGIPRQRSGISERFQPQPSQSVLVQTAEVASVFYLGPRFSFSNGRRRQRHRRHHRTHSLTPTEDCMLSAAEKLCLPVPRRRRGPLGLQALSGVGRSPSDLGVPRPGLVMDILSGTHSSVPPLRGHPLLKLQQLNFIHNFSSSLSLPLPPPRAARIALQWCRAATLATAPAPAWSTPLRAGWPSAAAPSATGRGCTHRQTGE